MILTSDTASNPRWACLGLGMRLTVDSTTSDDSAYLHLECTIACIPLCGQFKVPHARLNPSYVGIDKPQPMQVQQLTSCQKMKHYL